MIRNHILLLLAALTAAAAFAGPLPAQEESEVRIQDARDALDRWLELRRAISQEKRDWALGREMLAERTRMVQREVDNVQTRIGEARTSLGEAEQKRQSLAADKQRLGGATGVLHESIAGLEARTLKLVSLLPDPVREAIKPISQQIPADPAQTRLGIGQRFAFVIGVLNELNKRSREISVTREVRTVSGGQSAEVSVLYLGIAQGYYVSGDGRHAGVGVSSPDGWTWTERNQDAAAIQKAIAVLRNEDVAQFVRLPLTVR